VRLFRGDEQAYARTMTGSMTLVTRSAPSSAAALRPRAAQDASSSTRCSTDDPEEATSVLTSVYAPHDLTIQGKGRFGFNFQGTHSKDLTVGFNRFGTDVRIEVPPPSHFYTLCYSPDGAVETTSGNRSMVASPTTATILHPDFTWSFSHWSPDSSLMCIRVDRAALEDELGALLGRPTNVPIDFGGSLDLRHGVGQDFFRILQTVRSASGDLSGRAELHPLIADRTGQLLRSALLLICKHNYSDLLNAEQAISGVPAAVRRVLEAVEVDPMQVRSATEAAQIAHLSVRALEKAFEEHVGVSPVRFARRVRLARARADLLSGDPGETTVMTVASRWGFGHTGRFASLYEERYGELPSVTLNR
jgi:AraC-like DNA-binding protein